jgi:peptidoglycan/LPS O-acetylase OafA/YrhL
MSTSSQATGIFERLDFIDALRGLAALYVVAFHAVLIPDPPLGVPGWLAPVLLNGGTGVTLFFVLSAFTMCYTLHARPAAERGAITFYLRRFFRIAPLYYVWLAAMLLLTFRREGRLPGAAEFVSYLTFAFNPVPAWQEGLVWASWTLGVEMLFYLLFPLIFRFTGTLGRAAVFVAVSFAIAAAHDAVLAAYLPARFDINKVRHISLGHQLPVFAIGILTYYLHNRLRASPRRSAWGGGLLAVGGIGFVAVPLLVVDGRTGANLYAMAVVYAAIVLGLSAVPLCAVVNPLTVFMGTISYSLYLNHPQLVFALIPRLYRRVYAAGDVSVWGLAACVAGTFLLLVPVSYVTYRTIEQPGLRFGSRLLRKLRRAAPTVAPPIPNEPVAASIAP